MTALIDADGMFYIIAHHYKDVDVDIASTREVWDQVDRFIKSVMELTKSNAYMGFMGNEDRKCFRDDSYKYNHYKGSRPPEADFMIKWRAIIRQRMTDYWKFHSINFLEADDMICYMAHVMTRTTDLSDLSDTFIICSPDKDLKQIPGIHFDYKKEDVTQAYQIILPAEANKKLWVQVIMGDSSDSIAGVPGLGEVKARAILDAVDPIQYKSATIAAYCKYFGPHYGPIIFQENYNAVKLMDADHPYFSSFKGDLGELSGIGPALPPVYENVRPFE